MGVAAPLRQKSPVCIVVFVKYEYMDQSINVQWWPDGSFPCSAET